ncbi:MAG: hypothetical protein RR282_00730 [Acinetobacter sp.]
MNVQPTIPAMVATGGGYGDGGLGMGGGLMGGLLLGSLLGRNNLFGQGAGAQEGCVTPSNLSAQLANVTDTQMNSTVLQTLGDIKASVPLAEGQMQLALAGAQADINANVFNASQSINANIATGLQTAIQGQAQINKNISDSIASGLAAAAANKEATLAVGAATGSAILNSKFELANLINADGEKTRALITSFENANTQRLLGERQDQINELLAEGRRRDDRHGIEITMNNTQNQNQLQAQAQQQQIASLTSCLHGLSQNIQATNQAINIGGFQQANPTNTNTNVRA